MIERQDVQTSSSIQKPKNENFTDNPPTNHPPRHDHRPSKITRPLLARPLVHHQSTAPSSNHYPFFLLLHPAAQHQTSTPIPILRIRNIPSSFTHHRPLAARSTRPATAESQYLPRRRRRRRRGPRGHGLGCHSLHSAAGLSGGPYEAVRTRCVAGGDRRRICGWGRTLGFWW